MSWSDLRPTRRDMMALSGIVLENAADMAACFPELWPTAEAARQDRTRSVTNCYYRDLYNSQMSHSSAEVTYRPTGPGHRARIAQVDLIRIPDPEAWLTNRLGTLARFDIRLCGGMSLDANLSDAEASDGLAPRLGASKQAGIATHRPALDGFGGLQAATPGGRLQLSSPTTQSKDAHL